MPKIGEYVKFKNYERKIKSNLWFMQILKAFYCQNIMKSKLEEIYTNTYQKHVACSYGYKLVCPDDKFSKSFKIYLGEDAVYNFINIMRQWLSW